MKNKLQYVICGMLVMLSFSCSKWNTIEKELIDDTSELKRLIPLIEAQTEEDLTPAMRKYYKGIREYKQTPHVKGFGWFGNWTGKGSNPQNYLKVSSINSIYPLVSDSRTL